MSKREKLVRVIGIITIAFVIAITIWGCVSGSYNIAILTMICIQLFLPFIINKIKGDMQV